MQWLIANMWIAMAAATVLGLLFGFAFRGLLVGNRVQKAEVEREIAKTELTQSKAEVEALYAAQRKQKEETTESSRGGDVLVAALDERERRITALDEELTTVRAELQQLQDAQQPSGNALETAGAAVAGAVAGVVLSDGDQEELIQLRDRNAWLEERVGALETDIAAQSTAAETAEAPGVAAVVTEPESSPADEKTRWQSSYLRMRVDALEAKLIERAASASEQEAGPETEPASEPELETEPVAEPVSQSGLDEELAQLRWRNRYLEGRLAYFEQAPEDTSDEIESAATEASETEEVVEEAPTAETVADSENEPESETASTESADEQEADLSESDAVSEPEIEPAADVESESTAQATSEPEIRPSEAMLAELDGRQPAQVERPSDGGDDLTTITGIGPRIAEVLNGLGIWTFAQISEWKPENETWIENHLSFKGRVSRENWVGQAKQLLVAA